MNRSRKIENSLKAVFGSTFPQSFSSKERREKSHGKRRSATDGGKLRSGVSLAREKSVNREKAPVQLLLPMANISTM